MSPMSRIPLNVLSSVPQTRQKTKTSLSILAILLLAAPMGAQQAQQPSPRPDAPPRGQEPPQSPAPLIVRAGTQLALVLTHPIDSKTMHRGDTVFAETTSPVFVDHQVVIPAGAFVQGKVEKLTRQGSRAEMLMQSVSLALPDGSVVNIGGPLEIASGEGTAWEIPATAPKLEQFLHLLSAQVLEQRLGLLLTPVKPCPSETQRSQPARRRGWPLEALPASLRGP